MTLSYDRPSENLSAELIEVAGAARELLTTLEGRSNAPIPSKFPKDQLADICRSLIQLPLGTAEGCRVPLEYSRNRLPAIRREHIRIEAKSTTSADHLLTRGTSIDNRLASLITAVTTALDEYRRAAAEEEEDLDSPPDASITPPAKSVEDAVRFSEALDKSVENARRDLDDITKPDSLCADELKRQLKDVQGINRMSSAEMRMPRVVVGWLRKTTLSLKFYPDVMVKTAAKVRKGVDVAQVAYDRWHEFKHGGMDFIFEELRKTTAAVDRIAKILSVDPEDPGPSNIVLPSLPDACLNILRGKGNPMSSKQLLAELEASEFAYKIKTDWPAAKPYKRVYSALVIRERQKGDVVRVGGGYWALAEWLPKGDVKKIRAMRNSPDRREHAERTKIGMQAARQKGRQIGQRPKLGHDDIERAKKLFAEGKKKREVAAEIGVSPMTLDKAFPERVRRRKQSTEKNTHKQDD